MFVHGLLQPVVVMRALRLVRRPTATNHRLSNAFQESVYWQGDFVSEAPSNDPPRRPSGEGSVLHVLKQPILGLSLTPESANTLAEIGDKFKDGYAARLLFLP